VGGIELSLVGDNEPTVRYHSGEARILTHHREPVREQFQVGSLTGAVASQKVTEARKGSLSTLGNRAQSVKTEGSLTARTTIRAGRKLGLSDPTAQHGMAVAQRIKVTLGITG
jgi:hypothetical protein